MLRLRPIHFFSIFSASVLLAPLAAFAVKISDPINAGSALEIWARVLKAFLGSIGIFALANFVFAGVGLIASRGNPEQVKKSRDNMLWTLVGIVFLLSAYAILSFVFDRLSGAANLGA